MSMFAVIGENRSDIASNSGWSEFIEWISNLDNVDDLRHLIEYGWDDDLAALADDLAAALEGGEPTESNKEVAEALAEILVDNPDGDNIVVTNGEGGDEETNEDDQQE
jgi:hypothetical protein